MNSDSIDPNNPIKVRKKSKSRMAQKKAAENVLTWIADEQLVHEQAEHGDNKRSVGDSLSEQHRRVQMVRDYRQEVDKVTSAVKDSDVKDNVNGAYSELNETANKRLGCLSDIAQIASLEDLFNSLSIEFSQRATSLVHEACAEPNNNQQSGAADEQQQQLGGEGIARAAQSCILSVRNNWAWISKLVRCTDVHLEHVTQYHQFFHTAKEYEQWMPIELNKAEQRLARPENSKGGKQDAQKLLIELKEVLVTFLHWQGKINDLFKSSQNVIPVQLRTTPLEFYRPIKSLANYKTKEIAIQEDEELTLLDNSSPQLWLVRNMHAREASVPSVICLIPGPDPDAVALATKLRLRFLGIWTQNVKRIGKTMIWFMLLVFGDPDGELASSIKSVPELDRDDMIGSMNFINKSMVKYWSEYPDFKTLQTKFRRVKELLEEGGDGDNEDGARDLSERVQVLDQMLKRYRDFWSNWETNKVLVETTNLPEQILICDKWQQLNFIKTSKLLKNWHSDGLEFTDGELQPGDSSRSLSADELRKLSAMMNGSDGSGGYGADGGLGGAGGLDGLDGRSGSGKYGLDGSGGKGGADGSGSFGEGEGSFGAGDGLITKQTLTTLESDINSLGGGGGGGGGSGGLQDGSSSGSGMEGRSGMILREGMLQEGDEGSFGAGEFTSASGEVVTTEATESVTRTNGLHSATVQSAAEQTTHTAEAEQISQSEQEEKKTFVITGVVDPSSGQEVSMQQAVLLGIINSQEGTYVNTRTGTAVPIPEAMNQGNIKVEFTTVKKSKEKRRDVGLITIKTQKESRPYTVKAVVDAASEKELSVDEAIEKGILNQTTGTYHNTREEMDMSLADALDSGLLIVEFDKSAPEVAPEVVTKTYAIHAVVDQKSKTKVTFTEAVRKGLIDKSTGAYYHNLNKENIYVGDAIKKGFIKATVVKDPTSLDIDPENTMVVDKVEVIRKKLLTPMKAMAAFKKAGGTNGK